MTSESLTVVETTLKEHTLKAWREDLHNKRKNMPMYHPLKGMIKKWTPADERIELQPRNRIKVTMTDAFKNCIFEPGYQDKNLILFGWKDAIGKHDAIVNGIEKVIKDYHDIEREFKIAYRLFQNHQIAWIEMNNKPAEMEEYEKLKFQYEGADIKNLMDSITTIEERAQVETEWERYKELEPWAERIIAFKDVFLKRQEEKDEVFERLKQIDKLLNDTKAMEKKIANDITEDHQIADEQKIGLGDIFPKIRLFMAITEINGQNIEDMPYKEILKIFKRAVPPHVCIFQRYDYRRHELTKEWFSQEKIRALGKWVEDPRMARWQFVDVCRKGSISAVQRLLDQGFDVQSDDPVKNTGLHYAAANNDLEMINFLIKNKIKIEERNKHMETPMILAVISGNLAAVELLVLHKAKVDVFDRYHRTPFMISIVHGYDDLIKYFWKLEPNVNLRDKQYKWTALHYAASRGNLSLVKRLIEMDGNVYLTSRDNCTPQDIARRFNHFMVVDYLQDYLYKEPAQKVFWGETEVWVGNFKAAEPKWCTDREFTAVLSINDKMKKKPSIRWLEKKTDVKDRIKHYDIFCNCKDDDKTQASWLSLVPHLEDAVNFIDQMISEKRKLLVHCTTGFSTSAIVFAAYNSLRRKIPAKESLKHMKIYRNKINPSISLSNGLEDMQDGIQIMKIDRLKKRIQNTKLYMCNF